ncbi:hypothetical protein IMG5_130330 [Ichthyophthirius multifiliis]|uniref:Nucleotide exchange factor Fes1 domain-containing protein n=1 Tax=Ichthyophthirius multifiliis TaxID=5932 RepID=G0QW96_ICHMU|nr:hypothetical protein IMG5_130330 [Ichthyophthirius multifiliis]EGR30519.1 hypothetical protein IMG5_130330 [Ichthyophthirius multifiliis]|eukprot:XP_004032106.1 hypothetical protein IMG5_130330 [Ichthyophthirius multifiliis]
MLDWKGLLKWSLSNTDGTQKKDIKPMEEKTKQWLQEALADYALQDIKVIQEILQELAKEELNNNDDEEKRINLLERLEDILDSLDMADSLYQIGGLVQMIKLAQTSMYPKVQCLCFSIFITCNQNNSYVQQWSIYEGAFNFINTILNSKNIKVKEMALSALSSLCRGENLQSKRDFIDIDGVEFLVKIINEKESFSQRMKNKAFLFLKDLVFYDDRLHFTYNNLDAFANTNAKVTKTLNNESVKVNNQSKNNDITFDQNQELKKQNEDPKNKKYRNIVKNKLIQMNFIQIHINLLHDFSDIEQDNRVNYLDILKNVVIFSNEIKQLIKETKKDALKKNMLDVMKLDQQDKGSNDFEIQLYKEILNEIQ